MSKNITIILLGFILIFECCLRINALPSAAKDSSSSEESGENKNAIMKKKRDSSEEVDEEKSPRLELLYFTLHKFALLANNTVNEANIIAKNVINEMGSKKEKIPDLEIHLKNFTEFVSRVEKLPKEIESSAMELFDLMLVFSDLVDRYNSTELEHPTSEDLLFEMSLEKYGLEELDRNFTKHFLTFTQEFDTEFQKYIATLTPDQQKSVSAMKEWYEAFKKETSGEKKVEIFAKFFDFYEN